MKTHKYTNRDMADVFETYESLRFIEPQDLNDFVATVARELLASVNNLGPIYQLHFLMKAWGKERLVAALKARDTTAFYHHVDEQRRGLE